MKTFVIAMALNIVAASVPSSAEEGNTVVKKGPNGKNVKVKMDGKYSTCVRDGQRMGYSASAAASYCRSRGLR